MLSNYRFLSFGKKLFLSSFLALLTIALDGTPGQADAGDLDPTFGDGGQVLADIEGIGGAFLEPLRNQAMVLQNDGKIVVGSDGGISLFRFNTDGTLDNSFGDGGRMLSKPSILNVRVTAIALQSDEKILVGGRKRIFLEQICNGGSCHERYTNDFHLARFNRDGTKDTTFGISGEVTTDFSHLHGPLYSENGEIKTISVQEDGKIVAVGSNEFRVSEDGDYGFNLALVRYNTDGSLDTTFGTDGIALHGSILDGYRVPDPTDTVLQPDGRIVILGSAFMARFNIDGTKDNTFGTDGIVTSFGNIFPISVTLQTDGKFVVAGGGGSYPPPTCGFGLIRLDSDGSPDTSFGAGEGIITDFGCGEYGDAVRTFGEAKAVAVQPDGKIVAVGELHTRTFIEPRQEFYDFALARYNPDGSLDTTFGSGGSAMIEFESREAFPLDMVLQDDGRIIAGGDLITYPFGPNFHSRRNLVLICYNSDGTIDNDFGADGTVIQYGIGSTANGAHDIIGYQGDGKFLVGGKSGQALTGWDFAITRHNEDGSLDTTFGEKGWVTTDFSFEHEQPCERLSASEDNLAAIAVQTDGKILAAGYSVSGYYGWCVHGINALAMARYLPNGSLDPTFGNEGRVLMYEETFVHDLSLQNDGKIVAVGGMGGGGFTVFRFNPDGSPDLGFGSGGLVSIDPFMVPSFEYAESLSAVAIQPDGKIVAAGTFNILWPPGYNYLDRWTLFRFNTDGSLDTTFGEEGAGGVVIFYGGSFCRANDIALQPDGKILVTGKAGEDPPNYRDFTIVRYSKDGIIDLTFGLEGVVQTDFGLGQPGGWRPYDESTSIALQPDGRIVVAGNVTENIEFPSNNYIANINFGLVRYNSEGSLDDTFGNAGKITTEFGSRNDEVQAVTIQANGKILLAGSTSQNFAGKWLEIAIARYDAIGPVTIADIQEFFVSVIDNGYLYGEDGAICDAECSLARMNQLLESAAWYIERDRHLLACSALRRAYRRSDGEGDRILTRDFVDGEAREWLAAMIERLMNDRGCNIF